MALWRSRYVWAIVIVTLIAIVYRRDRFDPESIRGKRVLITGASSGIGEELAYQYSRLGASVLVAARRAELLEQVVVKCRQLGAKQAEFVVGDMARPKDRARLIDETKARLGGLDHLILNHAVFYFDLWQNSAQNLTNLRKSMDVNFFAFVDIASRAMDMLVESNGSIGIISSLAGKVPNAFSNFYSPSKFALDGFFSGLRQELTYKKIDVSMTLLLLGYIGTETGIEVQTTKFPNFPLSAAAVNETAVVIIKGVQNRAVEIYYPMDVWHVVTFYSLMPKLADAFRLWILSTSLAV